MLNNREKSWNNDQSGFTLLEVLLAGFILFAVLTSMTLVYRGATLSSGKAEQSVMISSAMPSVRNLVSQQLFDSTGKSKQSGTGTFGEVSYRWKALLTHKGSPSIIIQQDQGENIRYSLWHVQLSLKAGELDREYEFQELSW